MIRVDEVPLVYVDVETDGKSHVGGHVIEVAALRYESGKLTRSVTSLVNPGGRLPPFITQLTGITDDMVATAPTFDTIADELLEIFSGAVMVAHNARFDYSFLRSEFMRLGMTFAPPMICTVKLSRALYPDQRRHRLADLIERHGLSVTARHRAYDDAVALAQFMKIVRTNHELDTVHAVINGQVRRPSIPRYIDRSEIDALPNGPGVYLFEDESGMPLYIGKSIHIKKRVMSHFIRDTSEYREFKISQAIRHISFRETPGELAALLLESHLIKTLSPLYNRRLRRQRKLVVTKRTQNELGYDTLFRDELDMAEVHDRELILATHVNRSMAQETLLSAVKTFDLCPKLCGLEKSKKACFSYHLGKCRGACVGKEPAELYNARVAVAFTQKGIAPWPYQGPVVVSEKVDHDERQGFVVDDWIINGTVKQATDSDPYYEPYEGVFDLDAYQILRSYIVRYGERLHIAPYNV